MKLRSILLLVLCSLSPALGFAQKKSVKKPPVCGDGIVQPNEACDDGNITSNDGCSAQCQREACGDGVIQAPRGEQCDDGNTTTDDGCTPGCALERCGDGVLQTSEACDDGNAASGDGCTQLCQNEFCGDGVPQANLNEECDDGNKLTSDGCTPTCKVERCGDGVLQKGEQCDDRNSSDNDGCSSKCQTERCGDKIVQRSETCDDGNEENGDGCAQGCQREFCGDGITQIYLGEQCDGPGCTSECKYPGLSGSFAPPFKSPSKALLRAGIWTGVGVAGSFVLVGIPALLIGPSAGHIYAEQTGHGARMAFLRLLASAGVLTGAGISVVSSFDNSNAGISAGIAVASLSGAALLGAIAFDLYDARSAVLRYNRKLYSKPSDVPPLSLEYPAPWQDKVARREMAEELSARGLAFYKEKKFEEALRSYRLAAYISPNQMISQNAELCEAALRSPGASAQEPAEVRFRSKTPPALYISAGAIGSVGLMVGAVAMGESLQARRTLRNIQADGAISLEEQQKMSLLQGKTNEAHDTAIVADAILATAAVTGLVGLSVRGAQREIKKDAKQRLQLSLSPNGAALSVRF